MSEHPWEIVKRAPVFRALGPEEAARVSEVMVEVAFPEGAIVVLEGERGDKFYLVLEGEVEIIKALGTPEQRRLTTRKPGEYFGEMSLLDPVGLRTATVRTLKPTRLASLARKDFERLLRTHPTLAYEMVRVLTLQLRDSNNATITDLRRKNTELAAAYMELQAAQAQIIEKEKLEQELRTAHRIQQSILPGELPRRAGYDFGALIMPARTVGGDLYDFIPLSGGRLGVAVGDVSDKGVPAAIFMALTRSLLRAEATRIASPRRALERVNRLLLDMNDEGMFVTLLYGILDPARRLFTYTRAGHELPLVVDAGGQTRFAPRGTGAPLGLFAEVGLDEQAVSLSPDETLLIYSDGATDITNTGDELFGMERLCESTVRACDSGSAQSLCDTIWRDIEAFRGQAAQADDVTLVAVRAL